MAVDGLDCASCLVALGQGTSAFATLGQSLLGAVHPSSVSWHANMFLTSTQSHQNNNWHLEKRQTLNYETPDQLEPPKSPKK
eukprot:4244062-Amphidinium_carterae.1